MRILALAGAFLWCVAVVYFAQLHASAYARDHAFLSSFLFSQED
jgi:hypothetical protein